MVATEIARSWKSTENQDSRDGQICSNRMPCMAFVMKMYLTGDHFCDNASIPPIFAPAFVQVESIFAQAFGKPHLLRILTFRALLQRKISIDVVIR